jgi:hypothetical protein
MKTAIVVLSGLLVSACGTVPAGCEPYDITEASNDLVSIRVSSKDPAGIAGALADAFLEIRAGTVGQVAVWAWPRPQSRPRITDARYARTHSGYVAEFHEGTLPFDICTSWAEFGDGDGELCVDQIEYDVAR